MNQQQQQQRFVFHNVDQLLLFNDTVSFNNNNNDQRDDVKKQHQEQHEESSTIIISIYFPGQFLISIENLWNKNKNKIQNQKKRAVSDDNNDDVKNDDDEPDVTNDGYYDYSSPSILFESIILDKFVYCNNNNHFLNICEIEIAIPYVNYKSIIISVNTITSIVQYHSKSLQSIIIWPYLKINNNQMDIIQLNNAIQLLSENSSLSTFALMNILLLQQHNNQHQEEAEAEEQVIVNANNANNNNFDVDQNNTSGNNTMIRFDSMIQNLAKIITLTHIQLSIAINCMNHIPQQQSQQNQQVINAQEGQERTTTPTTLITRNRLFDNYQTSLGLLILYHPHLYHLSIRNFDLDDQFCYDVNDMVYNYNTKSNTAEVTQSSMLQSLDIRYNHLITKHGYNAIYDMLIESSSTIHENHHRYHHQHPIKYTLKYLELDNILCHNDDDNNNSTRRRVSSSLSIMSMKKDIEWILQLNRYGRYDFLGLSPSPSNGLLQKKKICQLLIENNQQHDNESDTYHLSVLYTLLRLNPNVITLCLSSNQ